MFLKQIVLDGFKSYATRTVINGFDPEFNAITGLNGSGKSNILDSVCFVLGITNLTHVRASNLTDLIYKQGQAGVITATVTLYFDNTDKSQSACPVGYEKVDELAIMRQIQVGGKNTYKINGKTVQQQQVHNLFHSVQLNVNNPHFLIMQGRITKVINMKPPELLGMIEEAAGTRMYEMKKEAAIKTIEKKQRKVEEIDTLLVESINPQLEKLNKEREIYKKWCDIKRDADILHKKVIACNYERSKDQIVECTKKMEQLEKTVAELSEQEKDHQAEIEGIKKSISLLIAKRGTKFDAELVTLEQNLDKEAKALAYAEAHASNFTKELAELQTRLKAIQVDMKQANEDLQKNQDSLATKQSELKDAERELETAINRVKQAEDAVLTGVSQSSQGSDMDDSTISTDLPQTFAQLSKTIASVQASKQQLKLKQKKSMAEIQLLKPQLASASAELNNMRKELAAAQKRENDLNLKKHKLDFDEIAAESLKEKLRTLQDSNRAARERLYELESRQVPWIQVPFSSGEQARQWEIKDGGMKRCKGVLATLFSVKESKHDVALEEISKGTMRQIVVDDENTAKQLLRDGVLNRRVTVLPYKKLKFNQISAEKVKEARAICGREDIYLASQCVQYAEDDMGIQAAIHYAFGSTIVVPDLECARKVAYDSRLGFKAVTLEGDVFDPRGVVSGGSDVRNKNQKPILAVLRELMQLRKSLEKDLRTESDVASQVSEQQKVFETYVQLKDEYELAKHQRTLLEERQSKSSIGFMDQRLKELEVEVKESIPKECEELEAKLTILETRKAELDRKKASKEDAANQDELFKKQLESARIEHKKATTLAQKKKLEYQRTEAAVSGLKQKIRDMEAELGPHGDSLQSKIVTTQMEEQQALKNVAAAQEAKCKAEAKLEEFNEKMRQHDIERKKVEDELKASQKSLDKLDEEIKRSSALLLASRKEVANWKNKKKEIESMHNWVLSKSSTSTLGDLSVLLSDDAALKTAETKLEKLREEQTLLSTKINKRAMNAFEQADQDYKDVTRKKEIIMRDKQQIEEVIRQLDEKKARALQATWQTVNESFSSIFSTLLPGAFCKLEPADGTNALQGLEIKVRFGNVWKQSLSELSGGQRSLIALSLILALLRFKPAPLYILDEVDSALDLSHTQNIGHMIKTHFKDSQFLVVSLKEGMFNHANVVFRTKFVDGVSTVERTENALVLRPGDGKSKGKSAAVNNENLHVVPGQKRKANLAM